MRLGLEPPRPEGRRFLSLALATKHSAPLVLIFVVGSGTVLALVLPLSRSDNSRWPRFGKVAAVIVGALILWSSYFFRFAESNAGHDVFNRPLTDKISDVRSPVYRFVLNTMATSHVVPRPLFGASPIPYGLALRDVLTRSRLLVART
jgi:hypothetical protein